jgi:hypothetical protein
LYQHFIAFDLILQISAPRHLILQVRAIQTKDQATRKGGVHLEKQERSQRQNEAATAQEDRKNGKSRKAAAATNFPLLLHAAAKTSKNGYKGRGPEHSKTKPLHGTNHPSHLASTATPSIHHSTKKPSTFPPFPSTPPLQHDPICSQTKNSTMNPKNSLKNLKITR